MSNPGTTYFCKIDSPFQRDKRGRFTGEWADPRFADLADETWRWYYKWDGTSVGCRFDDDGKAHIFGRGTKTVMPDWQAEAVQAWADSLSRRAAPLHVYGELVGPRVQGNPHEFAELTVMEFARVVPGRLPRLPWPTSPFYEERTLSQVVEAFRSGENYPCPRPVFGEYEGVVGWYPRGNGLWTKLKVRDRWA